MILIIDFYDSFVFNLRDYIQDLGFATSCFFHNEITLEQIKEMKPQAIILSPGPFHPKDYPHICQIIQELKTQIPILGVCLGHQIIAYNFHGKIIQTHPKHGKSDQITHCQNRIFKEIPNNISVGRYHSLIVSGDDFPSELEIIARNKQGIIMAIAHNHYPIYGVQFHPESILSEFGKDILKNFLNIAASID